MLIPVEDFHWDEKCKEVECLTAAGEALLKRGAGKDNKIFEQQRRIERLETALRPGKQACDCCERVQYKGESFWAIDCQCGNHDDIGQAQAWCSMANAYEGATGKSVTADDAVLTRQKR